VTKNTINLAIDVNCTLELKSKLVVFSN